MPLPYQNPRLSPRERAQDLLQRMSPAEKVGQLMQLDGRNDLGDLIHEKKVGALLHINGERSGEAMEMAAATRLGIPLLIGEDCIHGHSFWRGATIFPTQLAMSCSWNPELVEASARVTALEVCGTGIHWTFSPVLCLTRDLRWGRVGETFGEDPFLIAKFGEAMIRGYQGRGLNDREGVLATAKHYAGYSETQGGRDASEADLSRRKLRSYFLPPFEAAARSGCMCFMTGYQSMEGIPSTANSWLLRDVLRDEWGFEGILVTDSDNVGSLVKKQKVARDITEAAVIALRAGNDLMMSTPGFAEGALNALETGLLQEEELDEVVRRVLLLKFRMGLFEDPRRPDRTRQVCIGCEDHQALNLKLAREAVVLLQNPDGLLPLDPAVTRKVAVIGPNADDGQTHLGDWAGASGQMDIEGGGHPREAIRTVLDGIRHVGGTQWVVSYAPGCRITDNRSDLLTDARRLAEEADVIVSVVGDDRHFIGEYQSTATLELQGGQIAMLEMLGALEKPMVVVLIHSKPQVIPRFLHEKVAIIEAFNPGMRGGQAVAEVMAGLVNPSGRLTISVPYHVGQQPVFYSQVRGQHGKKYADLTQSPHFAFGEGLSYTTFRLSDFRWESPSCCGVGGTIAFTTIVHNDGPRDGVSVVQVYVSDLVTSATWVQKELKTFEKVFIPSESQKTVRFEIPLSACSMVDAWGRRVVEAGEFEVEVALSSRDPDALTETFEFVGPSPWEL